MIKKISIALSIALMLTVVYNANSWEKGKLDGVKCPISGKPVVENGTAKHNGGTVYFCCTNCPKAFEKNTAKFAAKANAQLIQTGQAKQVKCPIAGRPVNPAQKVTVAGVEVGLCCGGCKAKATKAKGDAQLELVLGDKAFKKGFEVAKKKD